MDFLAFDFETANHNKSSVCALGIVIVENSSIIYEKHYYINPKQKFDGMNIHIHKITPDMVENAPTFSEVWEEVKPLFYKYPLVAHNLKSADAAMLRAACVENGILLPELNRFYDTMVLARENLYLENYKLETVANYFNINLAEHHNPLCDAKATALIMQAFLSDENYAVTVLDYSIGAPNGEEFSLNKIVKKASALSGFITPAEYTAFSCTEEKNCYLKSVALLPKTLKSDRQFIYNGRYIENACKCDIVGYGDNNTIIISLDGKVHAISLEHFKEMQPPQSSDLYRAAINTEPIYTEGVYEYLVAKRNTAFKKSPYADIVKINLNLSRAASFAFCGIKAFDCTPRKDCIVFCLKNNFFEKIEEKDIPIDYKIQNIKSLKDYTRMFISKEFDDFKKFVDYIFTFCESYVDENYVPDHVFDCCHRYMECSDEKHCTCPDYLYSKGCTYKSKLENGTVFFGKNRNVK